MASTAASAPRALAFDIETYGPWAAVPPRLQEYLQRRDAQRGIAPDDPKAAPRAVGLMPGLAQVVAIGLWTEAGAQALSLAPGVGDAEQQGQLPNGAGTLLRFGDEAALLRRFWALAAEAVAAGTRLVSFNGRGFDGPVLALRSSVLGVRPTVQLVGKPYLLRPHCDVDQLLTFFGARRERLSLDYWCGVYGVPSPKQGLDGAGVGPAFERGEHDAIAGYALADAEATGRLFHKLEATLLPLMELDP